MFNNASQKKKKNKNKPTKKLHYLITFKVLLEDKKNVKTKD